MTMNDDSRFYEVVAEELERGDLDKGVWTKALVEVGEDDPSLLRRHYVQLRVEKLVGEHNTETRSKTQADRERLTDASSQFIVTMGLWMFLAVVLLGVIGGILSVID